MSFQKNNSRSYDLAFVILSIASAVCVVGWGVVPQENLTIRTWLSCLGGMFALWSWHWFSNGRRIPFRSDTLVMFGFSLSNFLPPLYLSIRLKSYPNLDQHFVADVYPLVAMITLFGAFFLLIGYRSSQLKLLKGHNVEFRPQGNIIDKRLAKSHMIILVSLCGAVALARLVIIWKGVYYWIHVDYDFMFGQYYSVLKTISSLGLLLPGIFWVMTRYDSRWRRLALILTSLELLWILPSGSRIVPCPP